MLKQHDRKLRTVLLLTDVALCSGALAAVIAFGWGELRVLPAALVDWKLLLFSAAGGTALPLALRFLEPEPSSRLEPLARVVGRMVAAAGATTVVLAALAFSIGAPVGPRAVLLCVAGQLAALGALRLSILIGLRGLRRRGKNIRNVLIVGTGPRAVALTDTIGRHPEWGLQLVGYLDEGDIPLDPAIPEELVYKLVDFPDILREQVIDEVMIACPRSMLPALGPAVEVCSASGVPLTLMTDLFGDFLPSPRIRRYGIHHALTFAPVHHGKLELAAKRAIDVAGALTGLLVAAPVLLLSALAIRIETRGPIFFRQIRCGLYGHPFRMYKLRTMIHGAEAQQREILHLNEMDGPVFKVQQDPRITRVGRVLRTFSIDELPQLWNVLTGDMSLVGPRPPLPAEVAQYAMSERRRLSMRPGLTCLWQVSGRNDLGFDEWVKLDLQYIDDWSLGLDLRLLALTIPTVLRGTGR